MRLTGRMAPRARLQVPPGRPVVTGERSVGSQAALALRRATEQTKNWAKSWPVKSWPIKNGPIRTGSTTWLPVAYRRARPVIRVLAVACAVLLILPYLVTPLYLAVDPVSTLMLWRWATRARVERIVKPIDVMAPVLPRSVLAAEDERFCSHHGIDFRELRHVIKAEAGGIGRPRGGSTITQQLAKNLFLWPGHSYVRKALEFPLAVWIDLVIPKRRQLEIYLNIAEWGPNGEFGAEAGARRAFGKPASALSASEAALMAAALPNPVKRDTRRPGDGLRRLAATYVGRAANVADIDRCVRPTR